MSYSEFQVNEPRFLFRAKAQSREGAKEEGNQSLVEGNQSLV
ncbi:MAG: hypothetical protein RLZZ86_1877 [Cyanobacteriota bacterium]